VPTIILVNTHDVTVSIIILTYCFVKIFDSLDRVLEIMETTISRNEFDNETHVTVLPRPILGLT